MANTALTYLYRDAANYKQWARAVLAGPPTADLEERLRATLLDDETFIAHEVDLPSVYLYEPNDPGRDDHIRHELHSVEHTDDEPTDPRTFTQLVAAFEDAAWDEPAEMHRVGMVW
jgi:hypothetical protein